MLISEYLEGYSTAMTVDERACLSPNLELTGSLYIKAKRIAVKVEDETEAGVKANTYRSGNLRHCFQKPRR